MAVTTPQSIASDAAAVRESLQDATAGKDIGEEIASHVRKDFFSLRTIASVVRKNARLAAREASV